MTIFKRTAQIILNSEYLFDVYPTTDIVGSELSCYNGDFEMQICDIPGEPLDFVLKKNGKHQYSFCFYEEVPGEKQVESAVKLADLFMRDIMGAEIVFKDAEEMNHIGSGAILKKIENPRRKEKPLDKSLFI